MRISLLDWDALDSFFPVKEEQTAASVAAIHAALKREHEEEQVVEESGGGGEKRHKTKSVVPTTKAPAELFVAEIEQHNHRNNAAALFALNGNSKAYGVNAIINKPPQVDVLAYCARYRNEMPWYVKMQDYIASAADAYDYPDVPVMSREMLCDFLRAPKNKGERPCINLDREPYEGEQRMRCEAHRLTGGAFRLRELILGDTLTRVNEAIAKKQDYTHLLESVPDMCYLCHLWTYLKDSIHQRDKKGDKVVLINRFMVIIDQPGEYDRNKMLMSDKVRAGLWGPVPLYNQNNYIVHAKEQRIEESANLLFRPTRALLPPTDTIQSKASNPSSLTKGTPSTGATRP